MRSGKEIEGEGSERVGERWRMIGEEEFFFHIVTSSILWENQ